MKTISRSFKFFQPALAIVIVCVVSVRPAQGFTITLEQVGSNVVATGSGAIDLTGLTLSPHTFASHAELDPKFGRVDTGPTLNASLNGYLGFSGPTTFGSGGLTFASSGSGDFVGLHDGDGLLLLPMGYVSGSALSDTSTYDNASFASLGVTPGTYKWTWGTGLPNQNFTLVVPDTGSSLGLLSLALAGLFGATRFRSRQLA